MIKIKIEQMLTDFKKSAFVSGQHGGDQSNGNKTRLKWDRCGKTKNGSVVLVWPKTGQMETLC